MRYIVKVLLIIELFKFSETYLNLTSMGPTFVFRIDRCTVYLG